MSNSNEMNTQNKKPWYKKWWVWLIVGVVICGAIGGAFSQNNSRKDTNSEKKTTTSKVLETKETETETQPETKSAKAIEKEFKNSCKTITYKKLARNPDKYKGKKYKIKGQVIQVLDSDSWFGNSTTLRINITPEENQFADGGVLWSDTIVSAVNIPDGSDRIVDDDIITFWGTCEGAYTYESVLGQKITVPRIDIEYYKIENK